MKLLPTDESFPLVCFFCKGKSTSKVVFEAVGRIGEGYLALCDDCLDKLRQALAGV